MILEKYFTHVVSLDMDTWEQYVEVLESGLAEMHRRFRKKASVDKSSSEEADAWFDYLADTSKKLTSTFPSAMRAGVFCSLYAAFEHYLLMLCEAERQSKGLQRKPSELRGTGIHRSQTYLKKIATIPFPDGGQTWDQLVQYGVLRNCFLHAEGLVKDLRSTKDRATVEKLVKATASLSIDHWGQVLIEKDFLKGVMTTIRSFVEEFVRT